MANRHRMTLELGFIGSSRSNATSDEDIHREAVEVVGDSEYPQGNTVLAIPGYK